MSKQLKLSLIVVAVLLTGFGSFKLTQAYFTYQRNKLNTFKVGYNTIEVEEDYEPPEEIKPGDSRIFKKAIRVKNTGTVPCYIRVRLEYSDSYMSQFCFNRIEEDSDEWIPADEYRNNVYYLSNGDWTFEDEERCYYYTKYVEPNEYTSFLLDSILVAVPETAEVEDFDIFVYAESIQTPINQEINGELVAVETKDIEDGYMLAWEQMLERSEFSMEVDGGDMNE